MPDAGCRMPDAGCRMPDAGCRMPDAGCRMPDAGAAMPSWSPFAPQKDVFRLFRTTERRSFADKDAAAEFLGIVSFFVLLRSGCRLPTVLGKSRCVPTLL
jgi:hypothetical protein